MKKVMIAAAFVFCAAAVSMAQSANESTEEKKAASEELVTGVEPEGKTKKCDKAEKEKCSKKGKKHCDKKKACHDKKAAVIDRKRNFKRLV